MVVNLSVKLSEDKVLIKKRASETVTKAGIIIPDQYVENRWKERRAPEEGYEGWIVASGPGLAPTWDENYDDGSERIPMRTKVGDRVFFNKRASKSSYFQISKKTGDMATEEEKANGEYELEEYFQVYESSVCFIIFPEGDIRLLEDRVLVKVDEGEEKTKGGIIVPEKYRGKVKDDKRTGLAMKTGVVVAIGPGVWCSFDEKKSGRYDRVKPIEVKPSDKIYFNKYAIKTVRLKMDKNGLVVSEDKEKDTDYKVEDFALLWEAGIYGVYEE